MKICRRVSSFLDDQSKFSLHQIRTQFVLDVKKKEAEFCEGKLMGLAQEMIKRFDSHKERIKTRYARFKEWCMQNIEDQIQDIVSKFNLKVKDELTKIQTHFDDQEKMICILENEMKQQNSELKKQIDSGKKSTNDFISKQEKLNLNQNRINKDTENKLKEQANQILNV